MNLLAPLALLTGLLLPVIVALYLLKLRRVERPVSSIYLWRRAVRDVEANAPWQKLRPNLLMILQLLFLAILTLALARPFTWSSDFSGEAAILIIDSSASMSAADSQPSRLEAAKARARQLVEDLPDRARVTVIEAGQQTAVRLPASRDRRQAILAIDAIQPGSGGSQLGVALQLASAIAARQPASQIILLSDGKADLPERLTLRGELRYLPLGISGENQAVSLFNLEKRPDGSLSAFIQVSNYGAVPVQRRLRLLADGALINAFTLDLPARGEQSVLADDLPAGARLLEASLEGADLLALDDRALAVLPSPRAIRVALVSPGNRFLETALALLPGVAPLRVAPSDASMLTDADLTIYDGVAAPDPLPPGGLLFIAPPAATSLFTLSGVVERPLPRAVDAADPLLANVALAGVNVLDAARIELPGWARAVVMGDTGGQSTPLLLRGEVDGRRAAVLAFDLQHSDLPLQPAFPILFANLVDWLAPELSGDLPTAAAPGESLALRLPGSPTQASLRHPDGSSVQLSSADGQFTLSPADQLGYYELRWGEDQRAGFAVNLFSAQESDIQPLGSLPGLQGQTPAAAGGSLRGVREYWRPLAALALGLLLGEWLVYHRAALARIKDFAARRMPLPVSRNLREGRARSPVRKRDE